MPTEVNCKVAHLFLPRNSQRALAIKELFSKQHADVLVSNVDFFRILPNSDAETLKKSLMHIYAADLLVLVSVNSVEQCSKVLANWNWQMPNVPIAVMGNTSRDACQQVGMKVKYMPLDGNDSEALLRKLDEQNWQDKQVCILRAQDGRDYLAEQLKQRGAYVRIIALYERHDNPEAVKMIHQSNMQQPISHVLLSSLSVANIWHSGLQNKSIRIEIARVHWLCLSERIADFWRSLYPQSHVTVLPKTTDESIYLAIMQDLSG